MDTLPATMTAIEIREPGGPEALTACERPTPQPGPNEVLLRVAYAGVNRPDAMQRAGLYPPPPGVTDIPGLEAAGEIVALGEGVSRWRLGDRVTALVSGGAYAEYVAAHEGACLPIPEGLSLKEAASLPETFFTVWTNVFERGGLKSGEAFLVHGGTSGIGVAAIQLAKAFGARVFATAGNDEKCQRCLELGADRAINYREEDFVAVLKETKGADVILDMVGGDYVNRNIQAAARDGRIVSIAFQKGSKIEANFMPVMLKRLTLTGSTLRIRPPEQKAAIAEALEAKVWPMIASGAVKPVVDSEFPLTEAAAAHTRLDSSAHVGKIMLKAAALS